MPFYFLAEPNELSGGEWKPTPLPKRKNIKKSTNLRTATVLAVRLK
jgi:hypothetical protein